MQNTESGGRPVTTWATAMLSRLAAFAAIGLVSLLGSTVLAQDVNNGKVLYNTPLVAGERSCSNGACHGPDPLDRQNRIQLGENAGNIANAINNLVVQMAFLRGHVTTPQLIDLAAYIADPTSATGQPVAQVSPPSLNFGAVAPGTAAPAQQITVTNTGTLPLAVSGVSSSDPDFAVNSNCNVVAINASCTVNVIFTPSATGARNATITILHNAPGGASTVSASGTGATASIGVLAAVVFPPTEIGSASSVQVVEVRNTGGVPVRLGSIAVTPAGGPFQRTGGDCADGGTVAPAALCTVAMRFVPADSGTSQGQLLIAHNAAGGSSSVALGGLGVSSAAQTRTMTEYRYTPLDYYFMTSRDGDKALLDALNGWTRTGFSFSVLITEAADRLGISRYYYDQVARNGQRGSHFYTLVESEKRLLASLNPNNLAVPRLPYNEGIDSYAFAPLVEGVGGSCPDGLAPVYRLFRGNAKFPDDPNHRFTTSLAIYNQFVGLGWDGEGVKFCVPAP